MAIRSVKNQYHGINAHLHSLWQAKGGWERFHHFHLGHLLTALKAQLRPMGYIADMEVSLQIRRVGDFSTPRRADILVANPFPSRPMASPQSIALTVAELIEEELDLEKPYRSIVIYERLPSFQRGEPVVWIELLSPTNKGNSVDALTYRTKRLDTLQSGLVFVEIDYLNETPPTFYTIPYGNPYRIIVLDPRPTLQSGPALVEEFRVDEQIPEVTIPLSGDDALIFDFDTPYQQTFEQGFFGDDVDYSHLPLSFDRYSPSDQLTIVRRMLTIKAHTSQDLEQAPFLLQFPEITLEDALKQLKEQTP